MVKSVISGIRNKRPVYVAAACVVGLVVVALALRGGAREGGDGGLMTADRVGAQRKAFDISTTANGELEARNKIEIRNPMERESTILEIIPEGVRVKRGTCSSGSIRRIC